MKHIIFAAALLATPANATPYDDAYEAIRECQSAETFEARKDALDRLLIATSALVTRAHPFASDPDGGLARLRRVNDWAENCLAITYE